MCKCWLGIVVVIVASHAFLGFTAINRIRILQKPVTADKGRRKPALRPLTAAEKVKLSGTVGLVDNDELRASLEKLGATIIGERKS